MLTCPMCRKRLQTTLRECPRCRADLSLLVDYLTDLEAGLRRAEEKTRAGQLGEAVRAYLEVLEVDPENPTARAQIGDVVTAVRQFDAAAPSRQGLLRLQRQARWKAELQDRMPTGCIVLGGMVLLAIMLLLLGYWWGFTAAQQERESTPSPEQKSAQGAPSRGSL